MESKQDSHDSRDSEINHHFSYKLLEDESEIDHHFTFQLLEEYPEISAIQSSKIVGSIFKKSLRFNDPETSSKNGL